MTNIQPARPSLFSFSSQAEKRPVELRKFPRLALGVKACVRARRLDKSEREYLEGVVANVSIGGMFIETSRPAPQGSELWIEFEVDVEGEKQVLRARALVRHTRRFLGKRGMGIEFIEFDQLGKNGMKQWLERICDSTVSF